VRRGEVRGEQVGALAVQPCYQRAAAGGGQRRVGELLLLDPVDLGGTDPHRH